MRKWRWISPVAALVLWQLLASLGVLGNTPTPLEVARGMWDLLTEGLPSGHYLHRHLLSSLERVFFGFAAAVVVGVPLGVAMGYSRLFESVADPLVELLRPVPPLAWLPLAVIWFGIGMASSTFLIFLGAFFPIALNTVLGVRSVDSRYVEAARTLGARGRTVLGRVLLPGSLPSIFTGLRIGMGIAWMTLIAAEIVAAGDGYGLGYMIMTGRDLARYDCIIAGIAVIGVVGFLADRLIRVAEKRLLRWR